MFLPDSVYYKFNQRITALEDREFESLVSRVETAESDIDSLESSVSGLGSRLDTAESEIDDLEDDVSDLISRCGTLESTVSSHNGRLTSLEGWKAIMPKRQDRYTGTTDSNGDVTITFPTGRYTNIPHIAMNYIFNNDNYGTFYNIKALSVNSVSIRVMRNKNSPVLLGGNIDPDEPLASTPITIIATEFA